MSGAGRAVTGALAGGLAGLVAKDLGLGALVSYWGDQSPFVAAAAALGALVWMTPLRRLAATVTIVLVVLWLLVGATPLTTWLAEDLVRREEAVDADGVFVLRAKIQDDGDPSAISMSRLLHGVELVAAGRAPVLVVAEVPDDLSLHRRAAKRLLEGLGVQGEVVSVGPTWNTRDEAVAAAGLVRQRGWKRLLLVTSPVHSRRAAAAFEAEGIQVVSSPAVETTYDIESLDGFDDRIEAFGGLLHEWVGLFVYRWRGWIGRTSGAASG